MDYAACMKDEDNIDDKLSLSWFKGWLGGLEIISNKESKIKQVGNFEFNDQEKIHNFKKHFCMVLDQTYLGFGSIESRPLSRFIGNISKF